MSNFIKIWEGFIEILPRLIGGFKTFLFYIFVRRSTQHELENKQLKKNNDAQKQQIKTAASPPTPWKRILERMRRGER